MEKMSINIYPDKSPVLSSKDTRLDPAEEDEVDPSHRIFVGDLDLPESARQTRLLPLQY